MLSWRVFAILVAAMLAGEPPRLPPAPASPPGGTPPIEVRPSRSAVEAARLSGTLRGEDFELDLREVTLELACIDCTRPATRVRPDLRGGFEFWGLEPGGYRLIITAGARTSERELELAAGEAARLELVIASASASPESPTELTPPKERGPEPRPRPQDQGAALRRAGLATTVVGSAMAVGGVLVASLAPCRHDGTTGANCDVDVRNTVALVLGVAAAGTLTAGIVSMVLGRSLQREQRLAAGIAFDRRGGGLVLVARF